MVTRGRNGPKVSALLRGLGGGFVAIAVVGLDF